MTIDILPTIAHLVGAKLPDHKIDGKNIWPLIAGEPGAKSPHEAYYFYWGQELAGGPHGPLEAALPARLPHARRPARRHGRQARAVRSGQASSLALFDLENDIGETTNVADQHPDVVRADRAAGRRACAPTWATRRPSSKARACASPAGLEEGDLRFDWQPGQPIPTEAK